MTEQTFNYSHLTLDELRKLASSPQVGAMDAMPHAFRQLADRVGEVAEILTRAQADLPNWWKGQAAEQAAATLGRAAAEAREFHGSAQAAATAVARCATIVAEQQHQMLGVPEVPEPGVTAVITRPATPMEALEAARQDAAYQAAREQAVQVVNGIAAQYVETRGQLTSIGIARGESFDLVTKLSEKPFLREEELKGVHLDTLSQAKRSSYQNLSHGEQHLPTSQEIENLTFSENPGDSHKFSEYTGNPFTQGSYSPNHAALLHKDRTTIEQAPHDTHNPLSERQYGDRRSGYKPEQGATQSPKPINTSPEMQEMHTDAASKISNAAVATEAHITPDAKGFDSNSRAIQSSCGDLRQYGFNSAEATQKNTNFNAARITQGRELKDAEGYGASSPLTRSSGIASHPVISATGSETSIAASNAYRSATNPDQDVSGPPFVPPFGIAGHVGGRGDDRSPRPSYLKERKSAWVSDVVAAPADGILTPEWFRQA